MVDTSKMLAFLESLKEVATVNLVVFEAMDEEGLRWLAGLLSPINAQMTIWEQVTHKSGVVSRQVRGLYGETMIYAYGDRGW